MAEMIKASAAPLDDYFSSLLAHDGEVGDQQVNWDDLLHDAVSPYSLQDALDSSSLTAGYAPLCLGIAGQGNDAQKRTQLLGLLTLVKTLPAGRVRSSMMFAAGKCAGGLNG